MSDTLEYTVSGMSCAHCVKAVSDEVGGVAGVESVEIDLDTKAVLVRGESLDDTAIRSAIDEAGYEAA
jgi:copper chaperone